MAATTDIPSGHLTELAQIRDMIIVLVWCADVIIVRCTLTIEILKAPRTQDYETMLLVFSVI